MDLETKNDEKRLQDEEKGKAAEAAVLSSPTTKVSIN